MNEPPRGRGGPPPPRPGFPGGPPPGFAPHPYAAPRGPPFPGPPAGGPPPWGPPPPGAPWGPPPGYGGPPPHHMLPRPGMPPPPFAGAMPPPGLLRPPMPGPGPPPGHFAPGMRAPMHHPPPGTLGGPMQLSAPGSSGPPSGGRPPVQGQEQPPQQPQQQPPQQQLPADPQQQQQQQPVPEAPPPLPPVDPEEEALAAEAAAIEAEHAARSAAADAEQQRRLEAKAWTAHKSASGQVYYHNTMTGDSSWTRPDGFAGDEAAIGEAPVPVAQAQVGGSSWYEVKCADGRRYYFNHTTQQTAWSMPPEVATIKARQAEEAAVEAAKARMAASEQRALAMRQLQQAAQAGVAGGPTAAVGGLAGALPLLRGGGADAFRQAHMQSMMAARQQAPGGSLPRDVRVTRFKQLLLEGGVNAFSLYAKVKAQLSKDERWRLLTSETERRSVFDDFCKNVATEQKALAAAAEKQAVADFEALLEEALQLERQLHVALLAEQQQEQAEAEQQDGEEHQPAGGDALPDPADVPEEALELSLEQLEKYWSNDERWDAVKPQQRAALFHERFGQAAAEAAARKEARAKQLARDFRLLLQQLGVKPDSSWAGGVRDAVAAAAKQHKQQQNQKQPAGAGADAAAAGAEEAEPGEAPAAPAGAAASAGAAAAAALDEAAREKLFREFQAELRKQQESEAAAAAQEAARVAAAEARRAGAAAEAEARQRKAARSDAMRAFSTLLAEVVRDPGADFEAWLPKLQRDPLGRASNALLDSRDLAMCFRDHTAGLAKAAAAVMAAVLDAHLTPLLPSGPPPPAREQLAPPLARFTAADDLLQQTGDERWVARPEQARLGAWRAWVDERVWGKPPQLAAAAPPAPGQQQPGARGSGAAPPGGIRGQAANGGRDYRDPREDGRDRERERERDRDSDRSKRARR